MTTTDHAPTHAPQLVPIQLTYHGIVRVVCEGCGHQITDAGDLEIANDIGDGTCDRCGHDTMLWYTVQVERIRAALDDSSHPADRVPQHTPLQYTQHPLG